MRLRAHWLLGVVLVLITMGGKPPDVNAATPPGAEYVGDETCAMCHDELAAEFTGQIHARIESFEVQGRNVGCEGCHGPGSVHADEGDVEAISTFGGDGAYQSCMTCHRGKKDLATWESSTHAVEGLECSECHTVHGETSAVQSCVNCHADAVAEFALPSHHPVRTPRLSNEGQMTCNDCHNVHSYTEGMLRTDQRLNDLCYTCHQAQEGPFIFEHAPVQEDCMTCHVPHGSVAENLLTVNEPALCLQCHDFHFHAGYNTPNDVQEVGPHEIENPYGERSFNVAFTTSCTQCHQRIHGSDSPSQALSGSGKGMTQ